MTEPLRERIASLRIYGLASGSPMQIAQDEGWNKALDAVLAILAADPTVCEVCGDLADGEPGRCHRHFRVALHAAAEPPKDAER